MGKVYVVTAGSYSEYHIVDVFRTKDEAEDFVGRFTRRFGNYYDPEDVNIEEYTIRDTNGDILTEWPDDEVIGVFYAYETNKLSKVYIESVHDVLPDRKEPVEKFGHYHDGSAWYRFYLPISTIPNAHQLDEEDKLESDDRLLKIAQDRYAMAKAYLVEQEEEQPKPIPKKTCQYLARPGVCGASITVLCGYQCGFGSGMKFGETGCCHPNVVKPGEGKEE